jgi:malic enzyme
VTFNRSQVKPLRVKPCPSKSDDFFDRSLIIHEQLRGKLGIQSRVPILTRDDWAFAYTTGFARSYEVITADPAVGP